MKTRCIELSRFESEILREYIPVAAERPLPATLCRSIYRRLEGLPVFESNDISGHAHTVISSHHVRVPKAVNE